MEVINYSHTQSKIYTTKTLMIDEMNILNKSMKIQIGSRNSKKNNSLNYDKQKIEVTDTDIITC
jgi:hypothetical protein